MKHQMSISYHPAVSLEIFRRQPLDYIPLLALFIANVVTIIFAVVQQWGLSLLVWIYLAQNIVIGFFQYLRILSLEHFSTEGLLIDHQPVEPTPRIKKKLALFFLALFGGFHVCYIVFLTIYSIVADGFRFNGLAPLDLSFIVISFICFVLSTLISYIKYKQQVKNTVPRVGSLVMTPVVRIVPMHVVVMIGGIIQSQAEHTQTVVVVIFLSLKTLADLIMHVAEHTRPVEEKNRDRIDPTRSTER